MDAKSDQNIGQEGLFCRTRKVRGVLCSGKQGLLHHHRRSTSRRGRVRSHATLTAYGNLEPLPNTGIYGLLELHADLKTQAHSWYIKNQFCILLPNHRTKQESVTMVTCQLLIQTAPCLMHCIAHNNLSIHHFLDFTLLTKYFVPSNFATGVILYRLGSDTYINITITRRCA